MSGNEEFDSSDKIKKVKIDNLYFSTNWKYIRLLTNLS